MPELLQARAAEAATHLDALDAEVDSLVPLAESLPSHRLGAPPASAPLPAEREAPAWLLPVVMVLALCLGVLLALLVP